MIAEIYEFLFQSSIHNVRSAVFGTFMALAFVWIYKYVMIDKSDKK